MSSNLYSAPASNLEAEIVSDAMPALWNPGATVAWGFFLSPIFGGILQMRNWDALGKPEEALKSKRWVIATALYVLFIIVLELVAPQNVLARSTKLMGVLWFIAWYAGSGRDQSPFVSFAVPGGYTKRGWLKPIGIGIGCYLLLIVAIGLAYFALIAAGVVEVPPDE